MTDNKCEKQSDKNLNLPISTLKSVTKAFIIVTQVQSLFKESYMVQA